MAMIHNHFNGKSTKVIRTVRGASGAARRGGGAWLGGGRGGRARIKPPCAGRTGTHKSARPRATVHFVIFQFWNLATTSSRPWESQCSIEQSFLVWKRQSRRSRRSSRVISSVDLEFGAYGVLRYPRYHPAPSYLPSTRKPSPADKMMAVAAAQKNREMFAMKSSYSIEVSSLRFMSTKNLQSNSFYKIVKSRKNSI